MGETLKQYRNVIFDNARWESFEFRDDDIVISTPSKCGTTWTQMICALLILQDPELPAPLTELSPWVDVQTRSIDKVFAQLEAQTHRRFIKSHTPFDGLPHDDRVTYICVGRDPRDAGVSWDNHFMNMNLPTIIEHRAEAVGLDDLGEFFPDGFPPPPPDDPVERFWLWIDEDSVEGISGLAGLLYHLGSFWEHRNDDNVVLLHYADLKADLEGQMRALASRLGIDVPESRWPTLVNAAEFSQMKGKAEQLAPQVTDGFWNATGDFFKKGSSGQWQSFFSESDHARYDNRVKSLASDSDFIDWVHNGSRLNTAG